MRAMRRIDSWFNPATGLGTSEDKTTFTQFDLRFHARDYPLWEALHTGDPIFGKIANKRPREAFRPGYQLKGPNLKPEDAEELQRLASQIGSGTPDDPTLDAAIIEAWSLANAQGGAAIVLRTTDMRDEEPLSAKATVTGFTVAAAQDIWPEFEASAFFTTGMRRTDWFLLAGLVRVHKSRVFPFFGDYAPLRTRLHLNGWGISKFVKPYRLVQLYMQGLGSVGQLLSDASQAVWEIGGLWAMVTEETLEGALAARMALYERNRSSGKAIMVDKETEGFRREPTPFTGIAESLGELKSSLAMAADMPETELFGRSSAGMNATGEGERIKWYDSIDQERKSDVAPQMVRLYAIIARQHNKPEPSSIGWGALYEPSAKEKAEVEKLQMETRTIAIENGTLSVEESRAESAAGGELFSSVDPKIAADEARALQNGPDFGERDPNEEPETEKTEGEAMPKADKVTIPLTPTDVAEVVKVDEARASLDLPAIGGTDGGAFIGAFKVRQQAATAAAVALEFPGATIETESATTKGKGVPAPTPPPVPGSAPTPPPKPTELPAPKGEGEPADKPATEPEK